MANPKTVEDYGLSLSLQELRTFPEGRAFVAGIRRAQRDANAVAKRFTGLGLRFAAVANAIAQKHLK